MALKISRTRLLDRNIQHRDAWLCVLATEGADTEPRYFQALQERALISRSRVRVLPLPTPSASAGDGPDPRHVLSRLIRFQQENALSPDDQLWLVLDVDHHKDGPHKENFVQVVNEARQRGYRLAISNPCFEVWLLLHFKPEQEVCTTACTAGACKQALGEIKGKLGASYPDQLYCHDAMDRAIARARALDADDRAPWPTSTGTHVHRLALSLPRR